MSVLFDTSKTKTRMKEIPLSEFQEREGVIRIPSFKGTKITAALALLISLAAAGGGGYLYWISQNQTADQAALEATYVQVSERVQALEDQLNKLRTRSEELQSELKNFAAQDSRRRKLFGWSRTETTKLQERIRLMEFFDQGLATEIQRLDAQLAQLQSSLVAARD